MKDPEINQGGEQSLYFPIPDLERYDRVRGNLETLMGHLNLRIEGEEILEKQAKEDVGALIGPSHVSWLDIVATGAVNKYKPMRFMGKEQLDKVPYVGRLAVDAGAFWVDRDSEESKGAAIQMSVDMIDEGEWVVPYPEGTRNRSKDHRSIGRVKSGPARIALLAEGDTPVILIGIGYKKGLLRKKASPFNMGLVVGEPFYVEQAEPTKERVRGLTNKIANELLLLKNLAVDLAESK